MNNIYLSHNQLYFKKKKSLTLRAIADQFRCGHLTRTLKFSVSLSLSHKTYNLRAVAQIANHLSFAILSCLSETTPILAEHMASLNKDYISQVPLQPGVTM